MRAETIYRFRGHERPRDGIRASVLTPDVTGSVATLRLFDPIDSWGGEWGVSAKEFAAALDALPDDTTEIQLHINSPGGEVYEGIAILNALRAHAARVVAVVDGLAASAASFIAAGADEVVMGRNTQLMIHDAWGLCVGNAADMRDVGARLDKISDNIASVYAAKAGGSVESWRSAMLAETWYSAQEAVAVGLADRVDEPADVDEATAAGAFDLSMFTYQGRDQAPPPPVPGAPVDPATTEHLAAAAADAARFRARRRAELERLATR